MPLAVWHTLRSLMQVPFPSTSEMSNVTLCTVVLVCVTRLPLENLGRAAGQDEELVR
jgi:hypothetical protein